MAKRVFMAGAALCAAIGLQGCGASLNSASTASPQDQARRGNAELLRNKQISSDLQAFNIVIEKRSSDQDAVVVQEVHLTAKMLNTPDLQKVQALLNEYVANAADILTVINTPGITFGGDTWALARYTANARAALQEVAEELRSRAQAGTASRVSH